MHGAQVEHDYMLPGAGEEPQDAGPGRAREVLAEAFSDCVRAFMKHHIYDAFYPTTSALLSGTLSIQVITMTAVTNITAHRCPQRPCSPWPRRSTMTL